MSTFKGHSVINVRTGRSVEPKVVPWIKLFKDDGLGSDELDVYGEGGTNAMPPGWNDTVSSLVVVSGTWELFSDIDFGGNKITFAPGAYASIEAAGRGGVPGATPAPATPGWNDALSSLRCVSP